MKNKTEIMKSVSSVANKTVMKLKKHSPEILVVAGVVGAVASAVIACKATTKVGKITEEAKDMIDSIHESEKNGITPAGETYTKEDAQKELAITYVQTGIKYAKLYAPAVILGSLSITSILASNDILRKRNVALGAAYAAIDKSFKEYRGRVIERFGEQVDHELKYNIKAKKFEEVETDPETGKQKKVKKTVMVTDPNLQSDYAVYFDNKSRNYETNMDYNRMFLKAQQQFANDKLQARGHIFLNEVLDDLDLPRSPAGQIVGWTKDGPDGYVNFRILEVERETEDGRHEPALLLDFNVEGDIWSQM
jgi:hypothetical protein